MVNHSASPPVDTSALGEESVGCRCWTGALPESPRPLFRIVCHCQTCQRYTRLAYNDECTLLRSDCPDLDLTQVTFESYQSPLLPILRGTCQRCGKPAYCITKVGPWVLFVMVPSAWFDPAALPTPVAHIYYHRRVADRTDSVPTLSGHLRSQLFILVSVGRGLWARWRNL